jgi:anti-anti-sigma factor
MALRINPSEDDLFRCETERSHGRVYVRPVGELDMATVPIVAERLRALRAQGVDCIVVDLRGVEFADSCALRLMLTWTELSHREDFSFRLVDGPGVQRLIEITQTRQILDFLRPSEVARAPRPA